MLSRILRNHLGLWRGTAVIRGTKGTVHPERKMLVQHDMHPIPRHFQLCCFAPSCQRSTFSKSCSRDSMSVQYYHHLSCKNCAHRFAFPSLSAIVFSCAYLSCHAGFNGTRWKIGNERHAHDLVTAAVPGYSRESMWRSCRDPLFKRFSLRRQMRQEASWSNRRHEPVKETNSDLYFTLP
jgi:hypothetical protein